MLKLLLSAPHGRRCCSFRRHGRGIAGCLCRVAEVSTADVFTVCEKRSWRGQHFAEDREDQIRTDLGAGQVTIDVSGHVLSLGVVFG